MHPPKDDACPVCILKYDTKYVIRYKYDTWSPCIPKYDSERPHSQKNDTQPFLCKKTVQIVPRCCPVVILAAMDVSAVHDVVQDVVNRVARWEARSAWFRGGGRVRGYADAVSTLSSRLWDDDHFFAWALYDESQDVEEWIRNRVFERHYGRSLLSPVALNPTQSSPATQLNYTAQHTAHRTRVVKLRRDGTRAAPRGRGAREHSGNTYKKSPIGQLFVRLFFVLISALEAKVPWKADFMLGRPVVKFERRAELTRQFCSRIRLACFSSLRGKPKFL
eukprot:COSAG02_NODE_2577_length_8495_cov_107.952477_3_plen_277_part_00